VRSDNQKVLGFYRGLGYGEDQVLSLGKRLILD
jgi:ribosomal protein S18 acetylase RimI-like enzyme